jgi:predicted NBD/HSP70 family sugar kinase
MPKRVLCVDIGGTSTKAGIVSATGELEFVDSIPTRGDAETFVREICGLVDRTVSAKGARVSEFAGVGVAVAGFLDDQRNCFLYNSNIAWLEGFALRDAMASCFSIPLEVEIDSNAAAMAEWCFGSGRGSKRFLCITSGTGLGVGMIIDGHPLRFAYGCLGDIGHIVVQPNGPLCTCGGHGCAEIMVSAPAVAARFRKGATLRDVINAARAEDAAAIRLLEETGEWLGIAIASLAQTFFPDHIAVAGGLSEAGAFVMNSVERAFHAHAGDFARSQTTLTQAALGARATLVGAAWPFLRNS